MKFIMIEDGDVHSIHVNLPSIGLEEADDMLEKNALPATALTDDDKGFSVLKLEVHSPQDFVPTEGFIQIDDSYHY